MKSYSSPCVKQDRRGAGFILISYDQAVSLRYTARQSVIESQRILVSHSFHGETLIDQENSLTTSWCWAYRNGSLAWSQDQK